MPSLLQAHLPALEVAPVPPSAKIFIVADSTSWSKKTKSTKLIAVHVYLLKISNSQV
jgi:hypothetical protein